MCWTSLWRSISSHPGKNGGRSTVAEHFKVRMCPKMWIRLPRPKWPKSWSHVEDPAVLLERNFARTPICWSLVGRTVRGSSVGTWMGQSSELEMSFWSTKTRFVLVGVRGWFWNGWKTAEHGSIVEEIDGTCWSWRTTSFLDHVYLGCTQRECNPNEDSVSQHRDEFLLPQLKNYQCGRNLTQKLSCGPAT